MIYHLSWLLKTNILFAWTIIKWLNLCSLSTVSAWSKHSVIKPQRDWVMVWLEHCQLLILILYWGFSIWFKTKLFLCFLLNNNNNIADGRFWPPGSCQVHLWVASRSYDSYIVREEDYFIITEILLRRQVWYDQVGRNVSDKRTRESQEWERLDGWQEYFFLVIFKCF